MSANIRELPNEWLKLNLGCNKNVMPGWRNVDIHPFDGVDEVVNLEKDWVWEDDSVHYIRAYDLVEHLKKPIHTMNEAWRVLGHGGLLEIMVPSTDGRGAFQDPTHVSFWNRNSFAYYSKKGYAEHYPGLIKCDFHVSQFDTKVDNTGSIWTWALCRAIKNPASKPVVDDKWFKALTSMKPEERIMPGYKGSSVGTIPGQG